MNKRKKYTYFIVLLLQLPNTKCYNTQSIGFLFKINSKINKLRDLLKQIKIPRLIPSNLKTGVFNRHKYVFAFFLFANIEIKTRLEAILYNFMSIY